jgi:membrane peptidoglycan carboxypeptidase
MKVGLTRVAAVARGFGFEGEMKPYPSLALGALEVRPPGTGSGVLRFCGRRVLPYPLSVHKVADENGQVAHRRHVSKESVTTPAKAYMMDSLLRSVVLNGTGQGLGRRGISIPAAGKTGTTNDYRDAWFVGYTPDILALVWVGFDDNRSVGFSGGGAGASHLGRVDKGHTLAHLGKLVQKTARRGHGLGLRGQRPGPRPAAAIRWWKSCFCKAMFPESAANCMEETIPWRT